MRSAKMRNGRAVLYSSATTDKVDASSGVIWHSITTWSFVGTMILISR